MTVTAWGAWNDARLTADLPATSTAPGLAGERLPYSSPFSGMLDVEQKFPVAGADGFAGASLTYVGDRLGEFNTPPRQDLPAYTRVDLRAGGKLSSWTTTLFVNNAGDSDGVVGGGLGWCPTSSPASSRGP